MALIPLESHSNSGFSPSNSPTDACWDSSMKGENSGMCPWVTLWPEGEDQPKVLYTRKFKSWIFVAWLTSKVFKMPWLLLLERNATNLWFQIGTTYNLCKKEHTVCAPMNGSTQPFVVVQTVLIMYFLFLLFFNAQERVLQAYSFIRYIMAQRWIENY